MNKDFLLTRNEEKNKHIHELTDMEKSTCKLPILFKEDKNGVLRSWEVWSEDDTVYQSYGIVKKKNGEAGKRIVKSRRVSAVNVGSAAEKSSTLHAQDVAASDWSSQLDKQYKPLKEDTKGWDMYLNVTKKKEENGGHNIGVTAMLNKRKKINISETNALYVQSNKKFLPMKAHCFDSICFDFEEGVYIQPKYDGWRCVASCVDGKISLTTGTSKQYPWFKHIREELLDVLSESDIEGLDGELYSDVIYDKKGELISEESRFSTIQSICSLRNRNPHPLEKQIKLYVFDIYDSSCKLSQEERFDKLELLFSGRDFKYIVKTPTELIYSLDEMTSFHTRVVNLDKCEGIVLREKSLVYKPGQRAKGMRKYKEFCDKEFLIIGTDLDEGVDIDQFVWVCRDEENNVEFSAKPMGSSKEKKERYRNREAYIGKYVTVTYQGVSGDGVPRFPIAKEIRDIRDN